MKENFKVGFASVLGLGAPISNVFIENAEPIMRLLLSAGQIGVAVISILFIYRKWRGLK